MHNNWSGSTTHTITSYHVEGHRFISGDTDLPILTMTYECGIGMSAGGFKNHWRMNVLVCQRLNGVRRRSQVSTQLIALARGQIELLNAYTEEQEREGKSYPVSYVIA